MGTAKSLISVIWTGGLSIYNNSTNSLLLRDLYYILNKQVCIIIIIIIIIINNNIIIISIICFPFADSQSSWLAYVHCNNFTLL